MNSSVDRLLCHLDNTKTVQETWRETASFVKSVDFDLLMYGYAGIGSTEGNAEVATLSNFPATYQQRYRQERYYRDDPVVHHCIGNLSPLLVGRDSLCSWPDHGQGLTAIQHRIINDAADCGMHVGVVIPLRSPGRYPIAGMSLSNAMSAPEFRRFIADWGQVAQLGVLYAHMRLQMQLQTTAFADSTIILSARERECLLWVSRGLSSKETARCIGLSPKTVDFHIAKAMVHLGVTTRSHAVVRAISLGLLEP